MKWQDILVLKPAPIFKLSQNRLESMNEQGGLGLHPCIMHTHIQKPDLRVPIPGFLKYLDSYWMLHVCLWEAAYSGFDDGPETTLRRFTTRKCFNAGFGDTQGGQRGQHRSLQYCESDYGLIDNFKHPLYLRVSPGTPCPKGSSECLRRGEWISQRGPLGTSQSTAASPAQAPSSWRESTECSYGSQANWKPSRDRRAILSDEWKLECPHLLFGLHTVGHW